MNNNYKQATDIIDKAKKELRKVLRKINYDTIENKRASSDLESLVNNMEIAKKNLEYLSADVEEGILEENIDTGKFYIKYNDGSNGCDLKRGNALEIYHNAKWLLGEVETEKEFKKEKYYFLDFRYASLKTNMIELTEGMIVRKRVI